MPCLLGNRCTNTTSLEFKSSTILTSVNITFCNSFTKTISNTLCLTSETSETHIALSETPSSYLPIVSYQTVSANSPNVFEATYPIFVVVILLLIGTNIAFCIALWIKRNQPAATVFCVGIASCFQSNQVMESGWLIW